MRTNILAGLLGLAALAACSDGGPAATGQVEVGFSTHAPGPITGVASLADTYSDPSGNTLVIEAVSMVVRKLKLEAGAALGCGDPEDVEDPEAPDSVATDSTDLGKESECATLKLGPFLVDLPLNNSYSHEFTVPVHAGTYTKAKFQIHKPEGAKDSAFLAEHPEYAGVSIRVVGTYNGTAFVYTTGVTAVQKVGFNPPLVVSEGSTSFTLLVDISGWFRTEDGGLVDPNAALGGGPTASLVRRNILHSFRGFEDEDHDGRDDHERRGGS